MLLIDGVEPACPLDFHLRVEVSSTHLIHLKGAKKTSTNTGAGTGSYSSVRHGLKTLPGNMDVGVCLRRFDGQSRLLVKSLLSGTSGANIALGVFRRQQRSGSGASLSNFINTLCQDEITLPEAQPVTV